MKIGLNIVPVAYQEMAELAQTAEQLGYHSLWYGEHVAVPWKFDESRYPGSKAPFAADTQFFDPFAILSFLGGITKKIRLGTGISILPLRDPFLTARSILTADIFSNGRIDLGVGTGWLQFEFDILHREFKKRGAILDEFLDVLDRLWMDKEPEYHGKHFDFPAIGFSPKPMQKPRIPVHVGGMGPSLKRAARYEGWYGGLKDADEARAVLAEINAHRRAIGTADKPFQMTALYVWGPPDRATIEAFERAGVQQIVVTPFDWTKGTSGALKGMRDYAAAIGLKP